MSGRQKMVNIPERRSGIGRRSNDKKVNKSNVSNTVRAEVLIRDKGKCYCCGIHLNGNGTFDHLIPRSYGGSNTVENVFYCCKSTNEFFGNIHPGEKLKLILNSPRRKLDCKNISVITKIPMEQPPPQEEGK
ncbi:MAG: HNH endonuclease [Proteobacteria bacterium]|nr:HNH endonuclease [Pseudomonadota bacterium]